MIADPCPTVLLCRKCDGFLGDCQGNLPGCPVTPAAKSPTMRRIAVAYVAMILALAFLLFQLLEISP